MKSELSDPIVESLKLRYFDVLRKEDYPKTPKLTQEADHLEKAIRELQKVSDDKQSS